MGKKQNRSIVIRADKSSFAKSGRGVLVGIYSGDQMAHLCVCYSCYMGIENAKYMIGEYYGK